MCIKKEFSNSDNFSGSFMTVYLVQYILILDSNDQQVICASHWVSTQPVTVTQNPYGMDLEITWKTSTYLSKCKDG
jgi:hypothetical protein